MNPSDIEQAAQRTAEKRAKTSLQLGALSFLLTWLTGIPAIVIGAMALAHASPSARKRALTGIGLGSFTSLGTAVVLIVLAVVPSPPTASTPTASARAAASVRSGADTRMWKAGETITVGKCSYQLKKAFKRVAPDDAEPRLCACRLDDVLGCRQVDGVRDGGWWALRVMSIAWQGGRGAE